MEQVSEEQVICAGCNAPVKRFLNTMACECTTTRWIGRSEALVMKSKEVPSCVHCGQPDNTHEPSGCCGDGGGSVFESKELPLETVERALAILNDSSKPTPDRVRDAKAILTSLGTDGGEL